MCVLGPMTGYNVSWLCVIPLMLIAFCLCVCCLNLDFDRRKLTKRELQSLRRRLLFQTPYNVMTYHSYAVSPTCPDVLEPAHCSELRPPWVRSALVGQGFPKVHYKL